MSWPSICLVLARAAAGALTIKEPAQDGEAMKIGTRLMLLTAGAVVVVMLVASLITLRQRQASLYTAARAELRAHALTLRVALEEDYSAGRPQYAQQLINRLGENTGIYSIILFDATGAVTLVSNSRTPAEIRYVNQARQALAAGATIEIERRLGGEDFFSVIMPLAGGGAHVGAVEVVQPISFVRAHIARARRDIAITSLLLCLTILLVLYAATRYSLSRPIHELLGAARAVGQGDLSYRVLVAGGGSELARLAQEFNRMADNLEMQRRAAEREAEERLALARQLRHSERLAAVGSLAAGVAHEMGAPLQVIDGRAKQLLSQPDAPTEMRARNLTIIRHQAQRITNIVRQLLNLARPYQLRRQPVNLQRAVTATLEAIEADAERNGVQIEIGPDHDQTIEADANLLGQVFLNICRNAVQAMPRGGRLRIEFVNGAPDCVAVRFTDSGHGIAPEDLAHVFDPFFTTKEVSAGTGLGLAVASRIIEEHGGRIEAANAKEGTGAVFTVYLPKASAAV